MGGGLENLLMIEPVELIDRVADAHVQGHPAQRRSRLTIIRFSTPGSRPARPQNWGVPPAMDRWWQFEVLLRGCDWIAYREPRQSHILWIQEACIMTAEMSLSACAAHLMRAAIRLLDEAGEAEAAVRLRAAIDVLPPSLPVSMNSRVKMPCTAPNPAVVHILADALEIIVNHLGFSDYDSLEQIAARLDVKRPSHTGASCDAASVIEAWDDVLRGRARKVS